MRFDTGFWDSLFGERLSIELPTAGGAKKVSVTKKWFEQMVREGKVTEVAAPTVIAHVLDPEEGYCTQTFVVGEDIPIEDVAKFKDPATNAVYVVRKYEGDRRESMIVKKSLWDTAHAQYDATGSEVEAAAAFVRDILSYIKEQWQSIEAALAPVIEPSDRVLLADPWVRFEFALASLAQESQALPNLFDEPRAARLLGHVTSCLNGRDLEGAGVDGFNTYCAAWKRSLDRNQPPFDEVASTLYDRAGFQASVELPGGRFKDPLLLMAIVAALMMPGGGWWKANHTRYALTK